MKLLLDTSVWVEHLRNGVLARLFDALRGRFVLRLDAIVAAELRAGCRSRGERRVVNELCAPHERAGRLLCPERGDFERAALALSRLRESARPIAGAKGALLDGLIASVASREGALLVSANVRDFSALATVIPVSIEKFETFRERLIGLHQN